MARLVGRDEDADDGVSHTDDDDCECGKCLREVVEHACPRGDVPEVPIVGYRSSARKSAALVCVLIFVSAQLQLL